MKLSHAAPLVTLVLGAAACGGVSPGPEAEPIGHTASAIVGGTEESNDPAVVAIYYGPVQACSGSIIAKNIVLTAGHCAVDEALLTVPGVSIVFGEEAEAWDAREIDVTSWKQHPKYAGEGNPYDVALFTLAEDVDDVTPMTLVDDVLPDSAVGTMIRHVGYGENDEQNEDGEGFKRTATYAIHRIEPFMIWSGGDGLQTCEGDSGGPALLEVGATEKILGVVSGGSNCHDDGSDARVDIKEIHDWIVQTANLPVTPAAAATPSDGGAPTTTTATTTTTPEVDPNAAGAGAPATTSATPAAASGCDVGRGTSGGGSASSILAALGLALAFRTRSRRRSCTRSRPTRGPSCADG